VLAVTSVTGFTLNVGAGKSCSYSGVITNFAVGTTLTKTGPGTQILSGTNTYSGTTTVSNGALVIDGAIGAGAVTVAGGTLGGRGTIGGVVTVPAAGVLSPGSGTNAGRLSVGGVTLGADATVSIKLNGTNDGAYDQIVAGWDVLLGHNARLVVTLGYQPAVGDRYKIIDLAPAAVLDGWFDGMIPGSTVEIGGYQFQIMQWAGEDGNDVTLECVGAPTLTPAAISGFGPLVGGSFPLTFSGASGQTYQILSSTDVALPTANWTVLTNSTFGAGPVTYTDTTATNAQRYYRIRSP
jgi:autotransporter-associated beta strand protein